MKYKNAQDILPDKLLHELQKYVSGETLYIPMKESKKSWGEKSGARTYYKQRNESIRSDRRGGMTIEALAAKYNLSAEAIKKILY